MSERMSDGELVAELRAWAIAKPTFYPVSPELAERCKEAADVIDALRAELAKAERERDSAREALAFYAAGRDPAAWQDAGRTARRALKPTPTPDR